MPAYQFESAIFLVSCAAVSLLVFVLSRPQDGSIKLPTFEEDAEGSFELAGEKSDPFNVTKPEDLVDGQPIDEKGFWENMHIRKLVLSFILAIIVIVQTIALGWTIASDGSTKAIATRVLHVTFAVYSLSVSIMSIKHTDVPVHWSSIIHLSSLTALACAVLGVAAILPTDDSPRSVLSALWYAALALYFFAAAISVRTKRGPKLHFSSELIYSEKTIASATSVVENNVCGITDASVWDVLLFSYTTKVVLLGYRSESLEIADLPIVPGNMRATTIFARMKAASKRVKLRGRWKPKQGSGWELAYRLMRVNAVVFAVQISLAAVSACIFYAPAFFLRMLVKYLEDDPNREDTRWGWVFCAGLFFINAATYLVTGQLWSLSTTQLQVRLKVQLNSILFAKTLVRKDIASNAGTQNKTDDNAKKPAPSENGDEKNDAGEFSSKAQIMTLMTTDVDRVSEFAWHLFSLVDSPIEIVIGSYFLYSMLGVSCFFGLAVTCLFLPMNHYAGKVVVAAQDNLMKARDERVALMNEVLGAIRMLKFMAWERSFEKRVLVIREKELKYQRINYIIETIFNTIWNTSPLLVTLVSFWHFTVFRRQHLTPSIAFTSIAVFSEMKFALNALPETFINMLQSLVSLRRIEKYLGGVEIAPVAPLDGQDHPIIFQSATITWPQDRNGGSNSATPSAASTPRRRFILVDLTLEFPLGELTLVCGKLGSGKTLLLLALLGEADLLGGQIVCPRSPPDIIASFAGIVPSPDKWIVPGVCAYVPQSAWLQNASIKENILFNLPFVAERYQKTLEVCALISDLRILEDGDESEIGERGVNLSGGQKARVSLARAVYSRASVLFLDDVLSAVDAHTAHHLYHECLKGDLMKGRTVILVSHHVQLCVPGASYIVALDNGRAAFTGDRDAFKSSGVMASLVQADTVSTTEKVDSKEEQIIEDMVDKPSSPASSDEVDPQSDTSSTAAASEADVKSIQKKNGPRKLIEEEKRAVGRIGKDIWLTYVKACGGKIYWVLFGLTFFFAAANPVIENQWLKIWSRDSEIQSTSRGAVYYITVYAIITAIGVILGTIRWLTLYYGSIHASTILYKRLLEAVLFAQIRFHDTVSRGRLLNRFGKDFEGIDSSLSDNFGRSFMYVLSATITIATVSVVGGPPFVVAAILLGILYWNVAKVYGQTSRDMRRLDSVARSPLYSIYGETIAGVTILRAFGASSKFMRDMLRCVDTNINPYYWMWGVNRWLSARFNLLSSAVVGVTGVVALMTPGIDAAQAGFALAFTATITNDLLFMVRRFVGLEQSMVALERVKEFSELKREAPEFIEPRPPASWPSEGSVVCENLAIRYAPELPDVLHDLNFTIHPGEKVGILGRTGSGKSTLALSFFRFVEATSGRILVDGIDIAKVGLTDLRSKLTIIPQDPTILSGTLRSTLDVFDEYEDAEIFEALRRVHLIDAEGTIEDPDEVNSNVFRSLDAAVSEGGDNFSTGEKQLLCMARAILKRSKVLVMDEATASVDYATDELIGKTIRHEFAHSTILTIAHRLRTVIDYSRVMLLDEGRIIEFDSPKALLSDTSSKFHALCQATGKEEFAVLKRLAGV
ncbi:multidrug resistance-associated ABC transporter [Rickenella mellea]|uniref:Multidrug resistance-associated ABC transporter n=1 Tax=Rickenella mellea TaxID=50990 RepID=A0A4Y7QCQ5_9AGAM|nr:multidrug resistance-associated ABC transporter [Rickenella mellea]